MSFRKASSGVSKRRLGAVLLAALVTLTAAVAPPVEGLPAGDLVVSGQIVYGKAAGARRAATVDILKVYAQNPIYMRMKAEGLSETDGARGSKLFTEAQAATNKALAKAAKSARVDVITVPGGVSGGDEPIANLTQNVIDLLPLYHVDGTVLYGSTRNMRAVAELDSDTLLAAIPEYTEYLLLSPNDASYHLLRKKFQDAFKAAVRKAARDGNYDVVAEKGAVTSRLGAVADITPLAIAAL
ncbi:MAG: hypothetical protein ACYTCU_09175 [Planctomycetota bacterium]